MHENKGLIFADTGILKSSQQRRTGLIIEPKDAVTFSVGSFHIHLSDVRCTSIGRSILALSAVPKLMANAQFAEDVGGF